MMRFARASCVAATACVVGACGTSGTKADQFIPLGLGPELRLGVEGRGNRVGGIAALSSFVAVAWADAEGDVFVGMSRDNGATFATPQKVTNATTRTGGGMTPPVTVALVPGTGDTGAPPVAHILWRPHDGPSPKQQHARSTDGGRSFTTVAGFGQAGQAVCGMPALSLSDDGQLFATWRDCRTPALQVATLDGQGQWRALGTAPAAACDCCGPGLAAGPGSAVQLMWSAPRTDGSVWLATAGSQDGGTSFDPATPVSFDGSVGQCDDLAGAIALDPDRTVHFSWVSRSGHPEAPTHVLYATLRNGMQVAPAQSIESADASAPAHPQLLFDAGEGAIVAWDEVVRGTSRVALRQIVPAHHGPAQTLPVTVLSGPEPGSHPVLAKVPGGVIVAWTSGLEGDSTVAVRRVGLEVVCAPGAASPEFAAGGTRE